MEHDQDLTEFFTKGASELGINIPDGSISKFFTYANELLRWNQQINLSGITDLKEVLAKHFLDSLVGLRALRASQDISLLDVGTGAGFPGLPLKLVRQDLKLGLVEPNHKKAAFLRHLVGTFKLEDVNIIQETMEELVRDRTRHDAYDYICTRALNDDQVVPYAPAVLKNEGHIILYRGKAGESKITLKDMKVEREIPYILPDGFGRRVLTIVARQI